MKKFYFILLASLCSINLVSAQKGIIRGTLLDKLSKETIIGANIMIDGSEIGAVTNIN